MAPCVSACPTAAPMRGCFCVFSKAGCSGSWTGILANTQYKRKHKHDLLVF